MVMELKVAAKQKYHSMQQNAQCSRMCFQGLIIHQIYSFPLQCKTTNKATYTAQFHYSKKIASYFISFVQEVWKYFKNLGINSGYSRLHFHQ